MIIDPIHIDVNVKDWRTNAIGVVFIVIGILIAAVPFFLVAQDLGIGADMFAEIQDYARWLAGFFIITGLTLIGMIRSAPKLPSDDRKEI
jgi:hypothetical protein